MFLFCPAIRIFWEGRWPGGYVEPRRRLYDCELVYCSAGGFQLDIAGTLHRMRVGSVAIIPPGIWHESRVSAAGFAVRHCVHFDWLPDPAPRPKPIANYPGEIYDPKLISPLPPELVRHLPLVGHFDAHDRPSVILRVARRYFQRMDATAHAMLWPVLTLLLEACTDHH
ncbi:MAG: hypothetical protein WCI73_12575, partial [Phycisphaerae bacterium]